MLDLKHINIRIFWHDCCSCLRATLTEGHIGFFPWLGLLNLGSCIRVWVEVFLIIFNLRVISSTGWTGIIHSGTLPCLFWGQWTFASWPCCQPSLPPPASTFWLLHFLKWAPFIPEFFSCKLEHTAVSHQQCLIDLHVSFHYLWSGFIVSLLWPLWLFYLQGCC